MRKRSTFYGLCQIHTIRGNDPILWAPGKSLKLHISLFISEIMELNLQLDRKLEITSHSGILGSLRKFLVLGGNSHSALHAVKVWFTNWLLADVCSYHTDSKNLTPARPQPYVVRRMNVVSLGTENWGLWALPMWNLTMQLVAGQE